MKTIFSVLGCLLFPICWGAFINWIFTFFQRRAHRSRRPSHPIDYHI